MIPLDDMTNMMEVSMSSHHQSITVQRNTHFCVIIVCVEMMLKNKSFSCDNSIATQTTT